MYLIMWSFIYHFPFLLGLKKWVEIGNSGIFRPEMLLPMGLPENVSVIAWGLSLERYSYILISLTAGYLLIIVN